jgi:hypothetical protein
VNLAKKTDVVAAEAILDRNGARPDTRRRHEVAGVVAAPDLDALVEAAKAKALSAEPSRRSMP